MSHRLRHIALLLFLLVCFSQHEVVSFAAPQPAADKKNVATSLQSNGVESVELKDYGPELSSFMGNTRIPASLFAGAAAGAAFAMPLNPGDTFKVALVKRIYALLMMSSLSSQLLSIVVSTITMNAIPHKSKQHQLSPSLGEYIEKNYNLEWSTARFNFFLGIINFVIGCGLRAWVSISCPVFAKAALGTIVSATLISMAFLNEMEHANRGKGIIMLPVEFASLLFGRARRDPFHAVAALSLLVTVVYIGYAVPHTYSYLLTTAPQ